MDGKASPAKNGHGRWLLKLIQFFRKIRDYIYPNFYDKLYNKTLSPANITIIKKGCWLWHG